MEQERISGEKSCPRTVVREILLQRRVSRQSNTIKRDKNRGLMTGRECLRYHELTFNIERGELGRRKNGFWGGRRGNGGGRKKRISGREKGDARYSDDDSGCLLRLK